MKNLTSRKQKGRQLEKFVAKAFEEIYPFAYARMDSGSGFRHKEDVTLPDNVLWHIECKNHNAPSVNSWWEQAKVGCPAWKIPVLVYRLPYQEDPTVVVFLYHLIGFMGKQDITHIDPSDYTISMAFSKFMKLVKERENDKTTE